jgi:hypothetical protein
MRLESRATEAGLMLLETPEITLRVRIIAAPSGDAREPGTRRFEVGRVYTVASSVGVRLILGGYGEALPPGRLIAAAADRKSRK